jgi:hypothetical protein
MSLRDEILKSLRRPVERTVTYSLMPANPPKASPTGPFLGARKEPPKPRRYQRFART